MQDKPPILSTWKDIARYVGRSARTIQRWEKHLGFPIHRPSGREGGAVLAIPTEIDLWVQRAPGREPQNPAKHLSTTDETRVTAMWPGPRLEVSPVGHSHAPLSVSGVRGGDGSHAESYAARIEAHERYVRGQFFWKKRTAADIRRAIECYEEAIAKDPTHAVAYVGLAQACLVMGLYGSVPLREAYRQAKLAALMALRIDNSLGAAYSVLGMTKAGDWDLPGALHEFAHAIEMDPSDVTAHQWFAEHLICTGRAAEALRECNRALQLDPGSLAANISAGLVLLQAHECDRAIAQLRKAINMDRHCHISHRILRDAYLEKGMYGAAIAEHKAACTLAGQSSATADLHAESFRRAYARAEARGYWKQRLKFALQRLRRSSDLPYDLADTSPYHLAIIYAHLGRNEQAVACLQRAVDEYDYSIFYIKTNRTFDSLRSLPAVTTLMRRIGVEP